MSSNEVNINDIQMKDISLYPKNTTDKHFFINKLKISFIIITILLIISMIAVVLATPGYNMNKVYEVSGETGVQLFTQVLSAILMIWVATYGLQNIKIKLPDAISKSYPCPSNKVTCDTETIILSANYDAPLESKSSTSE